MRYLIVCLLLLSGCRTSTPGSAAPKNIELRVNQGIQILAEANLAVVKAVAQYRQEKRISDATALEILDWSDRVGAATQTAVTLMRGTADLPTRVASVQKLLTSVGVPASANNSTVAGLIAGAVSATQVLLEVKP